MVLDAVERARGHGGAEAVARAARMEANVSNGNTIRGSLTIFDDTASRSGRRSFARQRVAGRHR